MIPNLKTDAKMLVKSLLQIIAILLVFSAILIGMLSYIVKDGFFEIGPPPAPTEAVMTEEPSLRAMMKG